MLLSLLFAYCASVVSALQTPRSVDFREVRRALEVLPDIRVVVEYQPGQMPRRVVVETLRPEVNLREALRRANLDPGAVVFDLVGAPTRPRVSTPGVPVRGRLAVPPRVRTGTDLPLSLTLTNTSSRPYPGMTGVCGVGFTLLHAASRRPVNWSSERQACIDVGLPLTVPAVKSCAYTSPTTLSLTTLGGRPLPPGRYVVQATLELSQNGASTFQRGVVALPDVFLTVGADEELVPGGRRPKLPSCRSW